jgi:hypothetical protein
MQVTAPYRYGYFSTGGGGLAGGVEPAYGRGGGKARRGRRGECREVKAVVDRLVGFFSWFGLLGLRRGAGMWVHSAVPSAVTPFRLERSWWRNVSSLPFHAWDPNPTLVVKAASSSIASSAPPSSGSDRPPLGRKVCFDLFFSRSVAGWT